jgi:hypothetical protein
MFTGPKLSGNGMTTASRNDHSTPGDQYWRDAIPHDTEISQPQLPPGPTGNFYSLIYQRNVDYLKSHRVAKRRNRL